MADREVAEAVAGSFLATLPPEVVDELMAEGERTDYPAGSIVYREGSSPRAALVVHGLIRVYMSSHEGGKSPFDTRGTRMSSGSR
jgi:CRP/FNR family transcriptional regulator